MSSYMAKQGLPGANSDMVSAKAIATITKVLKTAIDTRVFSKVGGTSDVCQMFAVQHWLWQAEYSSIALLPRCMAEAGLCCKGHEIIAAVKLDALKEETIKENIYALGNMAVDTFLSLAKQKGFLMKTEPGSLVLLPPGFIYITFMAEGKPQEPAATAEGLRWSFTRADQNPDECKIVTAGLDMLLSEFGGDTAATALKNVLENV